MKITVIVPVLFAAFLSVSSGCATASKLNSISAGMDKTSVIQKIGDPDSSSANGNKELLFYKLAPSWGNPYQPYGVELIDGKVSRYGHMDRLFPPSPEELQSRRADALMRMQMMQNIQNQYQQDQRAMHDDVQMYMLPKNNINPIRTSCTSNKIGGQAYTDCVSQ